jgi:hypothetical protein
MGIDPVADVFALDPDSARVGSAKNEVETFVASELLVADVLRRFFLDLHRAVVMRVEVFKATVEVSVRKLTRRAVCGDFERLANARGYLEIWLIDGEQFDNSGGLLLYRSVSGEVPRDAKGRWP